MMTKRYYLLATIFLMSAAAAIAVPTDEEEEDGPKYAPGLITTYTDANGATARRVDDDLQLVLESVSPDLRLAPGALQAEWQGRLFTQFPGDYRIHVFAGGGHVEVKLNGISVLNVDAAAAAWHVSTPVKLTFGYAPIEVSFRKASDEAAVLKLHWSGPNFALEPIPDRHLFHDPKQTPTSKFDEGKQLVRALRCAACHDVPGETKPLPAPALTHLDGNLSPAWIVDWLAAGDSQVKHRGDATRNRMPDFDLSRDDAQAVAAYLVSASQKSAKVEVPKAKTPPPPEPPPAPGEKPKKPKPRKDPSVRAGEQLVRSLGCLACHQVGTLGSHGLFAGPDLTEIARKRPPEFFVRWFDDAVKVNADHRMPQFKLEPLEKADIAVYLMTLGKRETEPKYDGKLIERGRTLVAEHRCASCHKLPGDAKTPPRAKPLSPESNWAASCLTDANAKLHRPGYKRPGDAAIVEFLSSAQSKSRPNPAAEGQFVLVERNCIGCHSRGLKNGIADLAPAITAVETELLPVQATLLPPSLNGVGDKLPDDALDAALLLKREPLRPWLRVRMPKFDLAESELANLKRHLIDHDRIPDLPPPAESASDETAQRLAARRLVTADGFGCTSCHKIGNAEPAGIVNIAAHGTDLSEIGKRIRKPWFDRWVRNPPRIIPRMEMPAIVLPVRGVLHDNVDEQLAAVWQVLNEPGFTPPLPNPVRIVRARNVPELAERANVLTDVFVVDGKTYDSPIVIGLPNRHNILFDLESNRLAAWWTGDTALQRTKGKSWYWEPGGTMVVVAKERLETNADQSHEHTEVVFGDFGEPTPAAIQTGQVISVLDRIVSTPSGVEFTYRIALPPNGSTFVRMTQRIEPIPRNPATPQTSGFRRTIEYDDRLMVIFVPLPVATSDVDIEDGGIYLKGMPGGPRAVDVTPRDPSKTIPFINGPFVAEAVGDAHSTRSRLVIEYLVDLPIDTFPTDVPAAPPPFPVTLDVMPGYEAMQLPVHVGEMPTGLAWKKDGTLVFTSLKGRVIAAKDTNGDGLEDTLTPISDDLAAPYGMAVAEENGREVLDVINKYALLRLFDDNGDGYHERSVVAADGWGHTEDYHDWAVGLPKRPGGGYYVGLPCQQDDRDPKKAVLRGQGLRLVPREPTKDDPRRFTVEPFCGGLRFPMGLAVNRDGALFASDNQGNYNPFNEINHLAEGRRYGFINKLEAKPGFAPPVESPAIEIPHPWTRSVNGLCFLYTPPAVREKLGRDLFGPFEGHLVGCEFNDKSLFRMTLEKIGDTYQGAVYPLTVQPPTGKPTFEGPTVCEIAPDGDLYVGNMQDSGWGGGRNTGSLVRLRPNGDVPPGIAEIRAETDGFTITFTQPLDAEAAGDCKHYTIESFRRESTPQYGGNDIDRGAVKIKAIKAAADGRSVRLTLDKLQAGYVYEFHLAGLTPPEKTFFPAEAYYTLKRIPKD